jgi:hypothetical protein
LPRIINHFDIAAGDSFENAHRVDVRWTRADAGMFSKFQIPDIGGTWIRGFGEVHLGSDVVAQLAPTANLGLHRTEAAAKRAQPARRT